VPEQGSRREPRPGTATQSAGFFQRQHHDHGAQTCRSKNALGDILKGFRAGVARCHSRNGGLIANNQTPYKERRADLIAAAKGRARQDRLWLRWSGQPAGIWRWRWVLRRAPAISLTHVPYKGATQAATDVAAGQISPSAFRGLGTVAAAGPRRPAQADRGDHREEIGRSFPDGPPTVSEIRSCPGFFFNFLVCEFLAPVGTPKGQSSPG